MTLKFKEDEILFTSDTHLYHKRAAGFRNKSAEDHDELIISNWNNKIKPKDTIFHIGDFAMAKKAEIIALIKRLNGRIYLIEGNHDKKKFNLEATSLLHFKDNYLEIDVVENDGNIQRLIMSHYPMRIWNRAHYGSWQIHGHCHGHLEINGSRQIDVGVDTNDFKPYSYAEIKAYMQDKSYQKVDHHNEK